MMWKLGVSIHWWKLILKFMEHEELFHSMRRHEDCGQWKYVSILKYFNNINVEYIHIFRQILLIFNANKFYGEKVINYFMDKCNKEF